MKLMPLLLLSGAALPGAAANFVNLTFDEPDLSGPLTPLFENGPQEGTAAQVLRGWTVLADDAPLEKSGFSPPGTFGVYYPVGLFEYSQPTPRPDYGQYGVALQSLFGTGPELKMKQTGTVPIDAATLEIFNGGFVQVRINGELIGESNVSFPEFDISPWAGQTVDLEFDFGCGQQLGFDVFGFKPVPEPETWALLGVGLSMLGWFTWRQGGRPAPRSGCPGCISSSWLGTVLAW